jgi:hypothetical protein
VVKKEPEASTEEEQSESPQPQIKDTPQTKPRKRMQFSQIPTERIIKTMTNRDMMMETLHDETMEPHIHIAILLLIVIILAIIISLLGI